MDLDSESDLNLSELKKLSDSLKKRESEILLREKSICDIQKKLDEEILLRKSAENENNELIERFKALNLSSNTNTEDNLLNLNNHSSKYHSQSLPDNRHEIQQTINNARSLFTLNNETQIFQSHEIPSTIYIKEALNAIPDFDGENLNTFIRACKRAANIVPTHLEGELAQLLKFKLKDRAYVVVENYQFNTLDDFITRLKEIFSPYETLNNLRGKLDSLKKESNESMLDYINRVSDIKDAMLDRKRFDTLVHITQTEIRSIEKDIIDGFKDGLAPEIRNYLNPTKSSNLTDVFNDALFAEKQINRDLAKHGPQNQNHSQNSENKNKREQYNNNNKSQNRQNNNTDSQNKKSNSEDNTNQTEKICNYCKKPGHIIKECRRLIWINSQREQGNVNQSQETDAPGTTNKPRPTNENIKASSA